MKEKNIINLELDGYNNNTNANVIFKSDATSLNDAEILASNKVYISNLLNINEDISTPYYNQIKTNLVSDKISDRDFYKHAQKTERDLASPQKNESWWNNFAKGTKKNWLQFWGMASGLYGEAVTSELGVHALTPFIGLHEALRTSNFSVDMDTALDNHYEHGFYFIDKGEELVDKSKKVFGFKMGDSFVTSMNLTSEINSVPYYEREGYNSSVEFLPFPQMEIWHMEVGNDKKFYIPSTGELMEDYDPVMNKMLQEKFPNGFKDVVQTHFTTGEYSADLIQSQLQYTLGGIIKAPFTLGSGIVDFGERTFKTNDEFSNSLQEVAMMFEEGAQENIDYMAYKYGENGIYLHQIGKTIADIQAYLGVLRSLNIKLPQRMTTQGVGGQSLSKGQVMANRTKQAGFMAAFTFTTTKGDWGQRAKASGTSLVYMLTPAFSGWLDNKAAVKVVDLGLNLAWTSLDPLVAENLTEVWQNENYTMHEKLKLTAESVTYDVYFSVLTQSFKASDSYITLTAEDKSIFEATIKALNENKPPENPYETNNKFFQINKNGQYDALNYERMRVIHIENKANDILDKMNGEL